MAVEIEEEEEEEEVGCDGAIENIDRNGEENMSWSSSFSSASKVSSPGVDINASDDLLWSEIDLAERYLVSAMNEDAASTASTVLQALSGLVHLSDSGEFGSASCSSDSRDDGDEEGQGAGEVGKSDHEEMVECAGMVLLQSYRAIGRVGEFFEILRKLNLGVSELPLILLETGACLQISDGARPAARAALEEFLAVRSTCLLDEKYAEVVELYAVKVLVKGFQEIESAMEWVERANLTDDRRLVILKKIQLQMEQAKTTESVCKPDTESTTTASGDTSSPSQASFDIKDPVKDEETKEKNDAVWEAGTRPGADKPTLRFKSLALLKRFKISEGFFSLKTLLELSLARLSTATSVWQPFSAANLESRGLRFGSLAALFLFIFLRHRHTWRRLVGKSFSALSIGLRDLWRLAFSVQINPLAAVNPISAAY